MFCPSCGKALLVAGQKFCAHCGGNLGILEEEASPRPSSEATRSVEATVRAEARGIGPASTASRAPTRRPVPLALGRLSGRPLPVLAAVALVLAVAGVGYLLVNRSGSGSVSSPISSSSQPSALVRVSMTPSIAAPSIAAPTFPLDGHVFGYQAVSPPGRPSPTGDMMDITSQIVGRRFADLGLYCFTTVAGVDQIYVVVPQGTDVGTAQILAEITGIFHIVLLPPETYGTIQAPGAKAIPSAGAPIDPALPAQFTGGKLDPSKIDLSYDATQGWVVSLGFNGAASTDFNTWSSQHLNDYFAIVLDGMVISVPQVAAPITDGRLQVSAGLTQSQATTLAAVLRNGAFPYAIQENQSLATSPKLPAGFPQTLLPANASLVASATYAGDGQIEAIFTSTADWQAVRQAYLAVLGSYADSWTLPAAGVALANGGTIWSFKRGGTSGNVTVLPSGFGTTVTVSLQGGS